MFLDRNACAQEGLGTALVESSHHFWFECGLGLLVLIALLGGSRGRCALRSFTIGLSLSVGWACPLWVPLSRSLRSAFAVSGSYTSGIGFALVRVCACLTVGDLNFRDGPWLGLGVLIRNSLSLMLARSIIELDVG
eukprot:6477230-Amphidinium_carterae.1